MADEIEEAAQRFLAFLPEETRALLVDDEHILGMTQLVAENVKRCGVEAKGPGWGSGLGDDCWDETWEICGVCFTISWPYSNYYKSWTAQRYWGSPEIKAPSFPQLFDKIVAAATAEREADTEPASGEQNAASGPMSSMWRCAPPVLMHIPPCGRTTND